MKHAFFAWLFLAMEKEGRPLKCDGCKCLMGTSSEMQPREGERSMNGGVDWDAVEAGDFSAATTTKDMNARDTWYTVMHHAAQQGNAEAVRALIALGADPDPTTINGTSPAHLAAMGGHHHVVALLEKAGADLDLVCWGRASVRDLLKSK